MPPPPDVPRGAEGLKLILPVARLSRFSADFAMLSSDVNDNTGSVACLRSHILTTPSSPTLEKQ